MANREPKEWITVNGQHIPIFEGQSKQEAVDKALKKQKKVNDDHDKKDKQIEANESEADELNRNAQEMIKAQKFSKLGAYMAEHRKEFGLTKTEDAYMAAADIIQGNRELKIKSSIKKVIDKNEDDKNKQISLHEMEEQNKKYAPKDAVVEYFKNTSVEVTTSLPKWKEEVDEKGIPDYVYDYMSDSSINDTLRENKVLDSFEKRQLTNLDRFTSSSSVPAGTLLYSGITSEESLQFWNGKKDIKYPAYLSTSPDPLYAHGYGANTGVMLQIEVSKDTRIGKTVFDDSDMGTEGILGRNHSFKYIGESEETVDGEKFKIIKVRI